MINISGSPIKRSENISKKKAEGSKESDSLHLVDGIFPVLSLNEKQERDEREGNQGNQLGQFLRGVKDPSENDIAIEDI